jgi:hypothetical protein
MSSAIWTRRPSRRVRSTSKRNRASLRGFLEPLEERIALANAIVVTTLLDTGNPAGTTSLRQAITQADSEPGGGDTITFNPSLFTAGPGTIALGSELPHVTANMTITGPGPATLTLDGGGSSANFTVLTVASGVTASLTGLSIKNANTQSLINGAGLDNSGTLTVANCAFSNDSAEFGIGGAINNHGGNLTVTGSTLSGNSASNDGGGLYTRNGTVAVTGTTISGNSVAGYGGGVFNSGGSVTLTDCTLSGNTSQSAGGGVFTYNGSMTITGTTISNNSAKYDGGGVLNKSTLTLTDSTLSGNTAGHNGGGLENEFSNLSITGTTFGGNTAGVYGGGLFNLYGPVSLKNCTVAQNTGAKGGGIRNAGTLTLINTTISANDSLDDPGGGVDNTRSTVLDNTLIAANVTGGGTAPGDFNGAVDTASSFNLIGDGDNLTGITDQQQGNQIGTAAKPIDAKIGTLADNGGPTFTIALLRGSPAIDAGSSTIAGAPTIDQRGAQRGPDGLEAGPTVDIGAFEATSSYEVTSTAATGTETGTLASAVSWANLSFNANPANPDPSAANTVRFNTALFSTPQTIALGHSLQLTNTSTKIVISGPSAAILTLKGGGTGSQFSVVQVEKSVEASISDITITGGVSNVGGGVGNAGALHLASCVISGNTGTSDGGGIYNNGTLTLDECQISGNTSKYSGGGITNYPMTASITLTDCVITNNSSGSDGGIGNRGIISLIDSTMSGNTANDAAAIGNQGTLTIYGSTLSGNTAVGHGAALFQNGTATVTNSTLYGNVASYGGGIFGYTGTLTLTNVTISGNTARSDAGGGVDIISGATISLFNTLIARNFFGSSMHPTGDVRGAVDPASAFNLIGDGDSLTGISNGSQGNQIGTQQSLIDPKLGSLANNGGDTKTMALAFSSPARGTGSAALAVNPVTKETLSFDQRGQGFPRFTNGKVDIGAFELQTVATSLAVGAVSGTYGGKINVSATLTSTGVPVPGETIKFTVDGRTVGSAITNSSGVALLGSIPLGSLGAGEYANAIVATFDASGEFLGATGKANLTVNKAPLTVTARPETMLYGGPEPTLAYTITGFVNGDNVGVVTGTPSLHTTATSRSNVIFNPYPILVDVGSLSAANYDFPNLVDSTLIIKPRPLTITANNATVKVGQPFPPFTATFVGFVNDDNSGSFKTPLAFSTTAHVGSGPGKYPITPYGATDPNYAITFVSGTLTIQSGTGLTPDPAHPGKYILTVEGGPGPNQIFVTQAGGVVQATLNGQTVEQVPVSKLSRVVLLGGPQQNRLLVTPPVTVPSAIFGGPGPNILRAGRATSLIVGGPSNDFITGSQRRDFLIGGGGFDRIAARGGGDLVVGGTTSYDTNLNALDAILAEWTSTHPYAARVSNITGTGSGPSFASRLNGNAFLIATGPRATVRTNVGFAQITGGPGGNLVFRSTPPH